MININNFPLTALACVHRESDFIIEILYSPHMLIKQIVIKLPHFVTNKDSSLLFRMLALYNNFIQVKF